MATTIPMAARTARLADSRVHRRRDEDATEQSDEERDHPEGEVDRHQGEIRDEQRDVVGFAVVDERLECRSSIEGFVSHRD